MPKPEESHTHSQKPQHPLVAGGTLSISGGTHYWTGSSTSTTSVPPVVIGYTEQTEVADGSHGGHDPEARPDPQRRLVRSFGRWADGRFGKCVKVLSKHPELMARYGNVNRLCAWLKDQYLHTTKWRKGGSHRKGSTRFKKALTREHARDLIEAGVAVLPDWWPDDEQLVLDLAKVFEDELAWEKKNGYDIGMERDETTLGDTSGPGPQKNWDREDDLDSDDSDDLDGYDDLDGDDDRPEDSTTPEGEPVSKEPVLAGAGAGAVADQGEAASLEQIKSAVEKLLKARYNKYPWHGYCYVKETFSDHVIYEWEPYGSGEDSPTSVDPGGHGCACKLFRQNYQVDGQNNVTLEGDPVPVEVVYQPLSTSGSSASPGSSGDSYEAAATSDGTDGTAVTATDTSGIPPRDNSSTAVATDTPDPDDKLGLGLGSGSVSSTKLSDGVVTTQKVDDGAVTTAKLGTAPKGGFKWVAIRIGNAMIPALVDRHSRIIRGPRHLLGAKLPPIPKEIAAAARASESGSPESAEATSGNTAKNAPQVAAAGSDWMDCMKRQRKAGKDFAEARKTCADEQEKANKGKKTEGTKEGDSGSESGSGSSPGRAETSEATATAGSAAAVAAATPGEAAAAIQSDPGPNTEAAEVAIFESGAEATEVLISEYVPPMESSIVAVAESKTQGKPRSPSGQEFDAIIRVIRPGPGNPVDGFYYPADVIRRDIKTIAEGQKMYIDHLTPEEEKKLGGRPRSPRDWAAVIEEAWSDDEGVGYGGVTFVDDDFFGKAKKGYKYLGTSIRSRAKVKSGKVAGKSYRVVEGFVQGKSVDFVTEAGAGGGIVQVAESNLSHLLDGGDTQGGEMAKYEGTLDDLMRDRPDLLDEFRAQVESAIYEGIATGDEPADTDKPAATESTESGGTAASQLTPEAVSEMIRLAKEEAVAEAGKAMEIEKVKERQRGLLDQMLLTSGLRQASANGIRAELFDVVHEDDTTEGGRTGIDKFREQAKKLIDAKVAEIGEYMQTRVVGLGPGGHEVSGGGSGGGTGADGEVTEGSTSFTSKRKSLSYNDRIDSLLAEPARKGKQTAAA